MTRALCLVTVLVCSSAGAVEVRYQAAAAAVAFEHTQQAFKSFGFDTGWQPSTGPVSVRFVGAVGGGLSASAPGVVRLGWSPQNALWPQGTVDGGRFGMDVGVELRSYLRLDLQVPGGPHYQWEGEAPGLPKFDYRFAAEGTFTPFLLQGQDQEQVTISDAIQKTRILSIPLTQSFIPIPGVGGYLDVDAGGLLDATLRGKQVLFPEASLTRVSDYIEWALPEAPEVRSSAQYEALVSYAGTLALEPKVTVHVGPASWTLASFNLPIALPPADQTWLFNTEELSFALPRLQVAELDGGVPALPEDRTLPVDFGDGEVFSAGEKTLRLTNTGGALLFGELYVSGAGFSVGPATLVQLAPGESGDFTLRFDRAGTGTFSGQVLLETNDPWGPVTLALLGASHEPAPVVVEPDPGEEAPPAEVEDPDELGKLKPGCGCAGGGGATGAPAALFGVFALLVAAAGRRGWRGWRRRRAA